MKSESGMSYEEAVKVLGLKRGETVDNFERAFEEVRKHMLRLRDEADTPEKRINYELELSRFEEALKVAENHRPKKRKAGVGAAMVLLILGVIAAAAIWGPGLLKNQAKIKAAEARIPEAKAAVDARSWTEAEKIYQEIIRVNPKSKAAAEGLERVEFGRNVEQRMQVSFAISNVQSLMEERRWDKAEVAMDKALKMDSTDEQLQAFAARMKEERRVDDIRRLGEEIEQSRREKQWKNFIEKTEELAEVDPENERLPEFQEGLKEAKLVLAGFRQEADEIYEKALALDTGEYSAEALDLLREAERLAPSDKAAALLAKMTSYVQTVAVPEDVSTIAEAVSVVRAGDRVTVAAGIYKESFLLPAGVNLEGVKEKTVIEFAASEGSVIVIEGEGAPARLSNLSIRHSGVSNDKERFPVLLIQGAQAVLEGCEVSFGAGHGIAVIDQARCAITDCEIRRCGWDGVAVVGKGSEAVLQYSRSTSNLHHGLDVWDGGKVWVQRSRFQDNGLTGVLLSSEGQQCRIESSSIERNREVGIVASSGVHALVSGNLVSGNLLGGVFAEGTGTTLAVTSNNIEKNGEAGLVVSKDVLLEKEEGNSAQENQGKQKWLNADLTQVKSESILKALPVE